MKRPNWLIGCISVLALIAGCSGAAMAEKKTKTGAPEMVAANEYLIGADDVLAINVWHEPDLTKTVPVRPDGKISLPLIGEFVASGKTPEALQAALKTEFAKYINAPEVTVIVEQIKSQKINVMGEVSRPGAFPFSRSMTVLDAISLAGGLKDFAKEKKIYILRRSLDGTATRVPVNYKAAMKGQANTDIALQPRDTVVVP